MKIEDFQKHSHELVDWMFSYLKEIEKYPIKPDIKPGEIYNALPEKPPMNGEAFDKIFKDFNEIIIPGFLLTFTSTVFTVYILSINFNKIISIYIYYFFT